MFQRQSIQLPVINPDVVLFMDLLFDVRSVSGIRSQLIWQQINLKCGDLYYLYIDMAALQNSLHTTSWSLLTERMTSAELRQFNTQSFRQEHRVAEFDQELTRTTEGQETTS